MTIQTDTNQTLTASLLQALGNAPWLSPADSATIQWALFLASELDTHGEGRNIAALGKLYESSLHALGLSPEARSTNIEIPKDEVNPLAEIIAIRESAATPANPKQTRGPNKKRTVSGTSGGNRDAASAVAKDLS